MFSNVGVIQGCIKSMKAIHRALPCSLETRWSFHTLKKNGIGKRIKVK